MLINYEMRTSCYQQMKVDNEHYQFKVDSAKAMEADESAMGAINRPLQVYGYIRSSPSSRLKWNALRRDIMISMILCPDVKASPKMLTRCN